MSPRTTHASTPWTGDSLPLPVAPACTDGLGPPGSATGKPAGAARLRGVSVILPCRGATERIEAAVRSCAAAIAPHTEDYEIIVIDDASADAAAATAGRLAASERRVRLVLHAAPRGRAAAVNSGLRAARLPWCLVLDPEPEVDLAQLADFTALAPTHDLLLGRRIVRTDSWRRRARDLFRRALIRRFAGLELHDLRYPVCLVRRELIDRLELTVDAPTAEVELSLRAQLRGARIVELPLVHRPVASRRSGGFGRYGEMRELLHILAAGRRLRGEAADPRPRPPGGTPKIPTAPLGRRGATNA